MVTYCDERRKRDILEAVVSNVFVLSLTVDRHIRSSGAKTMQASHIVLDFDKEQIHYPKAALRLRV